jgi:hypothetical protein
MDLFEIRIKNQLPFIHLNRELSDFDLAPIVERENSIMFIMDDDPWQKEKEIYYMKLRFRSASDLSNIIENLKNKNKIKLDSNHGILLSKVCSVRMVYTDNESLKEDLGKKHYEESIQDLIKTIDNFNVHSLMMGMAGEV